MTKISMPGRCNRLLVLLVHILAAGPHIVSSLSSTSTTTTTFKGSAATPLQKKKVAVLGSGGYMGATVFGFLQRASSLYGTGISNVRCLGATADTAVRLNRILSKRFALAVADESAIKLTDLYGDVASIQQRLEGWDALILGNNWTVAERPCTANSFEKSPNEKTWEVYWDRLKSDDESGNDDIKDQVLGNVLQAAELAGIQHIVGVDHPSYTATLDLETRLESCGVPYTCIKPVGQLVSITDFSYRKGVVGQLIVESVVADQLAPQPSSGSSSDLQLAREDVAGLCVQSLLSLDWTTRRTLQVSCSGPLQVSEAVVKRPDQEWCVESRQLERALAGIA